MKGWFKMNVHVLSLMFRKKDNPNSDKDKYIFREVYNVGDYVMRRDKIEKLKQISKVCAGTWRIYESINERDVEKAKVMLMHKLIDNAIDVSKIDSEWKSILQKHECRGDKKFLLDLDNCTISDKYNVMTYLKDNDVIIHETYDTVNGFHIITDKFDVRGMKQFPFVDVKTDDMKLVTTFLV